MTGVSLIWLKYPNAGSDQDKNVYLGPVTKNVHETLRVTGTNK